MLPQNFQLMAKGTDPTTQAPLAYVACERIDHVRRICVYKLTKRAGSWFNIGQFVSKGYFRPTPEPAGRKLSDSQLDQTLIEYAERTA